MRVGSHFRKRAFAFLGVATCLATLVLLSGTASASNYWGRHHHWHHWHHHGVWHHDGQNGSTATTVNTTTTTVAPTTTTMPVDTSTTVAPTTTTVGPTTTTTARSTTTTSTTVTSGGSTAGPVGISGNWSLKFDDEFNGTSLNSKYWASTWFNGGTMNNVTTSASNVAVTGGNLVLTLSSSSVGALVNTDPSQASGGGFQFGTGYAVEGRIYFPGNGSTISNWPAFWENGQNWPANGEIDIAEGLGTLTSNYHSNSGANNSNTIAGTWSNGWHTYAVDRESGTNYIYWDGKLVRSYSSNDGGSPHYLIFNVGCSGGCVTGTASQIKMDYVRVWQKG